jgi:hypothetical protein
MVMISPLPYQMLTFSDEYFPANKDVRIASMFIIYIYILMQQRFPGRAQEANRFFFSSHVTSFDYNFI